MASKAEVVHLYQCALLTARDLREALHNAECAEFRYGLYLRARFGLVRADLDRLAREAVEARKTNPPVEAREER